MIRRALLVAVFLGTLGAGAKLPAQSMQLSFDPDLTAYLVNTTDAPISFDGYQIESETKQLDPAGWDSISDRFPARIIELITELGVPALTFGEANPTPGNLAELNLAGVGTLAAHAKFSLGKPFGQGGYFVNFYYKVAGSPGPDPGGPHQNPILIPRIPEPSSFLLAALAGLGLLAFRAKTWRWSRSIG